MKPVKKTKPANKPKAKPAKKTVKKSVKKVKPAKKPVKKVVKKTVKKTTKKVVKPVAKVVKPIEIPVLDITPAPVKAKPVKKPRKPKIAVSSGFTLGMLPEGVKWECKPADAGWRNYRLWAVVDLDWDEKAETDVIVASIKKLMADGKKALVAGLKDFDAKQLVVKTELKKDPYPYEPFIEAWVAESTEADMRGKLQELEGLMCMDPDPTVPMKEDVL